MIDKYLQPRNDRKKYSKKMFPPISNLYLNNFYPYNTKTSTK